MPSFALRELVVKHCSSGGSGLRAHVHDVGSPQGHHRPGSVVHAHKREKSLIAAQLRSSASRIRKESDQRQDGDHFGCKCCCCSCSSLRRCCCSCRSCSCCSSIWCCGGLFAVQRDQYKNHPWLVRSAHLQLLPCLARSRWAGGGCGGSFLSVSTSAGQHTKSNQGRAVSGQHSLSPDTTINPSAAGIGLTLLR